MLSETNHRNHTLERLDILVVGSRLRVNGDSAARAWRGKTLKGEGGGRVCVTKIALRWPGLQPSDECYSGRISHSDGLLCHRSYGDHRGLRGRRPRHDG